MCFTFLEKTTGKHLACKVCLNNFSIYGSLIGGECNGIDDEGVSFGVSTATACLHFTDGKNAHSKI